MSILFKTCDPKPSVRRKRYKRRGTLRRYVPSEECNGCSRRMMEEETDLLDAMEEERMGENIEMIQKIEMAEKMAAEDSASNSEQEMGEAGEASDMGLAPISTTMHSAGFGWREVKLEDFIKSTRRGSRVRA